MLHVLSFISLVAVSATALQYECAPVLGTDHRDELSQVLNAIDACGTPTTKRKASCYDERTEATWRYVRLGYEMAAWETSSGTTFDSLQYVLNTASPKKGTLWKSLRAFLQARGQFCWYLKAKEGAPGVSADDDEGYFSGHLGSVFFLDNFISEPMMIAISDTRKVAVRRGNQCFAPAPQSKRARLSTINQMLELLADPREDYQKKMTTLSVRLSTDLLISSILGRLSSKFTCAPGMKCNNTFQPGSAYVPQSGEDFLRKVSQAIFRDAPLCFLTSKAQNLAGDRYYIAAGSSAQSLQPPPHSAQAATLPATLHDSAEPNAWSHEPEEVSEADVRSHVDATTGSRIDTQAFTFQVLGPLMIGGDNPVYVPAASSALLYSWGKAAPKNRLALETTLLPKFVGPGFMDAAGITFRFNETQSITMMPDLERKQSLASITEIGGFGMIESLQPEFDPSQAADVHQPGFLIFIDGPVDITSENRALFVPGGEKISFVTWGPTTGVNEQELKKLDGVFSGPAAFVVGKREYRVLRNETCSIYLRGGRGRLDRHVEIHRFDATPDKSKKPTPKSGDTLTPNEGEWTANGGGVAVRGKKQPAPWEGADDRTPDGQGWSITVWKPTDGRPKDKAVGEISPNGEGWLNATDDSADRQNKTMTESERSPNGEGWSFE